MTTSKLLPDGIPSDVELGVTLFPPNVLPLEGSAPLPQCPRFVGFTAVSSEHDDLDMPVWAGSWLCQLIGDLCGPNDDVQFELLAASPQFDWTVEKVAPMMARVHAAVRDVDPRFVWFRLGARVNGEFIGFTTPSIEADHTPFWRKWTAEPNPVPDGGTVADAILVTLADDTTQFARQDYYGREFLMSATQLTGAPTARCDLIKVSLGVYQASVYDVAGDPMAGTSFQIDATVAGYPYGQPIILSIE